MHQEHEEDGLVQSANEKRQYLGKVRRSAGLQHCTCSALKLNPVSPMRCIAGLMTTAGCLLPAQAVAKHRLTIYDSCYAKDMLLVFHYITV
jgi:hypothetical protein